MDDAHKVDRLLEQKRNCSKSSPHGSSVDPFASPEGGENVGAGMVRSWGPGGSTDRAVMRRGEAMYHWSWLKKVNPITTAARQRRRETGREPRSLKGGPGCCFGMTPKHMCHAWND